jgi:hypothetical protein
MPFDFIFSNDRSPLSYGLELQIPASLALMFYGHKFVTVTILIFFEDTTGI